MSAWRCPQCLTNWPEHKFFDDCPACGIDTEPIQNARPDQPLKDALSAGKAAKFERFYDKWDATKPDERLQPTAEDDLKYPYQPELGDRRTYAERHPTPTRKKESLWGSKLHS